MWFARDTNYDKCINLGSFSADQPLSLELSQNVMGSDDLQPCIEDIRLEIDRLRREEQLLRDRYVSSHTILMKANFKSLLDYF